MAGCLPGPLLRGRAGMSRLSSHLAGALTGIVGGALGLLGASPTAAHKAPRTVTPEQAPKAWMAYAELVNGQLKAWMGGEDTAAVRLRAYLNATRSADGQSSVTVPLSLWIDAKGVVARVEFPPFVQEGCQCRPARGDRRPGDRRVAAQGHAAATAAVDPARAGARSRGARGSFGICRGMTNGVLAAS